MYHQFYTSLIFRVNKATVILLLAQNTHSNLSFLEMNIWKYSFSQRQCFYVFKTCSYSFLPTLHLLDVDHKAIKISCCGSKGLTQNDISSCHHRALLHFQYVLRLFCWEFIKLKGVEGTSFSYVLVSGPASYERSLSLSECNWFIL